MAQPSSRRAVLQLYNPHSMQLRLHKSPARYRIGSFGRQAGKSAWGNQELLKRAWEEPGVYWFISPTYDQAKIQYRRLVASLFDCPGVIIRNNQTELSASLMTGSTITFKSGEVFDNLRGETLNGVVIDEMRDQHPDLWPRVVRPMLTTTKGWAAFISTPAGLDAFYDLWEHAKQNTTGLWECFHAPSTCNPAFTQEEFESAKADMSEAEFAQEILAEFRDMTSGRAYTNYSEANDRFDSPFNPGHAYSPNLPVYCFMDFNLSPMAWTLGQHKGTEIHFTEEIFLPYISDPFEPSRNLIAKLRALPFDINNYALCIIGDASGKATQRTSLQSDYDIVCQELDRAGIRWVNKTPESNPSIKDRVNTVNARLRDANGIVHATLDPRSCPRLKRDFLRTTWKKTQVPTLDSGPQGDLGHASDAVGYGISVLCSIHKPQSPGRLRVLVR